MAHFLRPGHTIIAHGTLPAGEVVLVAAGNASADGGVIDAPNEFTNFGTINLLGSKTSAATGVTLLAGGILTNDGLIAANGADAGGASFIGVTGALVNVGTILARSEGHGAGAQIQIYAGGSLHNEGLLSLSGGVFGGYYGATLNDAGVLANDGLIDVGGEAQYEFSARSAAVLDVSGTLDNYGRLVVHGGIDSAVSTEVEGAVLDVSGVLMNSGQILLGVADRYAAAAAIMTITGTLINTGTLTAIGGHGAQKSITYGGTINLEGALNNAGVLVLGSGAFSIGYSYPGGGALLMDMGIITNSGSILLQGRGYHARMMVQESLDSTGSLSVGLGNTVSVAKGGVVTNEGAVDVAGGNLGYDGVSISGGALAVAGTLTSSGVIRLGGAPYFGSYEYGFSGSGAQLQDSGLLVNAGTIALYGGVGYFGPPSQPSYGATLSTTGFLTNSGLISVGAGMEAPDGFVYGRGGAFVDGGLVVNSGTITIASGSSPVAGALTVTAAGTLIDRGTVNGGGTLLNQGVINDGGNHVLSGAITVAGFTNDGTVQVAAASAFVVDSEVTSSNGKTGLFDLGAHATLTLGGAISAGESVSFLGGGGTLGLGAAIAFAGTLDGLGPTDTIDFLGLDVVSATANGPMIAIGLSGGATFSVALDAPLSGVSLSLSGDGQGGTDLVFSQTTASVGTSTGYDAARSGSSVPDGMLHLPA